MNHNHEVLFVIFGVSGDLAKRKLLPALYRLVGQPGMAEEFKIIGISRQVEFGVDDLVQNVLPFIDEPDELRLNNLFSRVEIIHNPLKTTDDLVSLRTSLEDHSKALGSDVARVYYLSIPPSAFPDLISKMGDTGHNEPFYNESERPRVLVEKPFGFDTGSALELINAANQHFGEKQIYRIDHYLAKETAQNLLAFRFKNALFESSWNSRHISQIKIATHETIDIEGRATFYEQTGALRDIIQSHHMQLLGLVMMAQPETLDSTGIHAAKLEFLKSIKPISKNDVSSQAVRAQYDGYRQSVGNTKSNVETYAKLQLQSTAEQWQGTDIILETGKGLDEKSTHIEVTFKPYAEDANPNTLIFRLAPTEGITLQLQAKYPGLTDATETVAMEFDYEKAFNDSTAEAYERVIADAFRGDQTLFASSEEVMVSWKIVQNVINAWSKDCDGLRFYGLGSSAQEIL